METTLSNGTAVKAELKRRQRKQPPPLPSAAGANEMNDASYQCKVDNSPIAWDALPIWHAFSLSSDGSYPHVKVSKRQYCDLRTGKAYSAGSGRCYRIIF
ncbi:hypothetical protein [uncultured Nostoc sp.]|uniref:hypothetical protein n=1 Tax=uncultured Nostoc sp. TaxID=340711 RepID=UPI0035CB9AC8